MFEHLLVALEDRPEILETDNIMAFNDLSTQEKRAIEKRNADNHNGVHEDVNDNFKELVIRESEGEHNIIESVNKESGNENKAISKEREDGSYAAAYKDDDRAVDTDADNFVSGHNELQSNDDILRQSRSGQPIADDDEDLYQEAADVFDEVESEESFAGDSKGSSDNDGEDTGGFHFTLEEAQEKILLVEKKLEEYNMQRHMEE